MSNVPQRRFSTSQQTQVSWALPVCTANGANVKGETVIYLNDCQYSLDCCSFHPFFLSLKTSTLVRNILSINDNYSCSWWCFVAFPCHLTFTPRKTSDVSTQLSGGYVFICQTSSRNSSLTYSDTNNWPNTSRSWNINSLSWVHCSWPVVGEILASALWLFVISRLQWYLRWHCSFATVLMWCTTRRTTSGCLTVTLTAVTPADKKNRLQSVSTLPERQVTSQHLGTAPAV